MPGLLLEILDHLDKEGPRAPGDVVSALGAPRYRVLAAFHCLEELGLVAPLYSKGTYKIFQITETGRQLLRAAQETGSLGLAVRSAVQQAQQAPRGEAEVAV